MNSDHLIFQIWKHHYYRMLRDYSLYTSYSVWVTFPPKMPHCQQTMHKESGNVGPPCGSARKLYLWLRRICTEHCFQDRSWSASASLRNSFKQSTAEINSLPRKVERLCFSAVGFIFMTVSHTVIFTIPAPQSNKCNNLWPRLLAKQEWFKLKDWDTGTEERRARFTRFDQYAIYTWKENWGKLDLVGTVGSRACLQLRSQQKDCMATRLVPAWISNHSVMFNLKTSEGKRWTSINHWLVIISWTVHGKQRCWVRSEFRSCYEGHGTFLSDLRLFRSSWTYPGW